MSRHTTSPFDDSALDAGSLLPGCSIPIRLDGEAEGVHAFRQFDPLPIDGLGRAALSGLLDSMCDVAVSLDRMHQAKISYGRITSTSFHNRGTASSPRATLWVQASKWHASDAVHAGDPESMYWTDSRLRSGASATPADDWFALGVVLSELLLSTEAVHRIWDLSRQEGSFVESLIRNLKRARCDRRFRRQAIALLQQGAAGQVSPSTINALVSTRQSGSRRGLAIALASALLTLLLAGWGLFRQSATHAETRQTLADLEQRLEKAEREAAENQIRADVLRQQAAIRETATRERSGGTARPVATPSNKARAREDWAVEIAGRPLEEAIEKSGALEAAAWTDALIELSVLPGQKQWRSADPTFRRLTQKVVDQPWDTSAFESAMQRGESLRQAYRRWDEWARGDSSFEQVRGQHSLMPSGQVKDLLGEWLGETLQIDQFQLRLTRVLPGEGNEWTDHLIGFETDSASQTEKWQWGSPDGKSEKASLSVDEFRPGEALEFWLQRDSAIPLWNSTVIRHTFKSPLLVWQLARELRLEDSESGYVIYLTTDRRYGPPAVLNDEVNGRPIRGSTPANKKVVDPMESLPF